MTILEIVGIVFIIYAAGYLFSIIFLAITNYYSKEEWRELIFMIMCPPLYFIALILSLWIRKIIAMTRSRRRSKVSDIDNDSTDE